MRLKTMRTSILAGMMTAALLVGTAAGADTLNATVTLRATILPFVAVTPVDADTVSVRSNCGWTIEAVTPDGSVVLTGGKTPGTNVNMPPATTNYTVVAGR